MGGALFSCYSDAALSQLDRVTWNLTSYPPNLCGRKSSAYVKSMHMTPEQLGLLQTLQSCIANRSATANDGASSAAPAANAAALQHYLAARRSTIASLHRPMVRPPAPALPASRPAAVVAGGAAAATTWSNLVQPADRHLAAARCVAGGRGIWRPLAGDGTVSALAGNSGGNSGGGSGGGGGGGNSGGNSGGGGGGGGGHAHEEPYLLAPDVLPSANKSKWWWGACDDDLRRGIVRPPRAAVMQSWEPDGEGCDALKKGRRRLPPLRTLALAFCKRHAGESVLFVGDSVQGQLFISFIMAIGVRSARPQLDPENMPRCAKDRKYLQSLAHVHEFHMDVTLCVAGEAGVRARFIRNELLSLAPPHEGAAAARSRPTCRAAL